MTDYPWTQGKWEADGGSEVLCDTEDDGWNQDTELFLTADGVSPGSKLIASFWGSRARVNRELAALAPEMATAIRRVCGEANRGVDGPGCASDEAIKQLHDCDDKLRGIIEEHNHE